MSGYLYPLLRTMKKIHLCNCDFHHFVSPFIRAPGILASQGKMKTKILFPDIQTITKIKLVTVLETFTRLHNPREQVRRFDLNQDDCED